ncbi:hypothetical protein GCM10010472_55980 [Pseudonocardia halophobica]|uniref:Secreted protein n=1 Tax=Pseudonocardia halophobica TaxID=29401 RepID=A0A9W6L874_9PSEU|nr:hypothetical protein [Pseudonocardia halophobica]GLL14853.1 hypothetical protein GCM10017577_60020 [Pseudonocardia halophobica]
MSTFRTARLAAVVAVALAALAGCGESSTHAASSGGDGAPSLTLPALRTKLASISLDECATRPAEQIYPDCARFVREVQNVVPAARAEAREVASPQALTKAADAVDGAVNRFTQDQCIPVGAPPGPASACGPDLASMQEALRALVAAVGR